MTGREHWQINVPATSAHGPWALLVELAGILPPGSWTLIGGMMVQLHALRAGVPHQRATSDVDVLLHIETGATTYRSAARLLIQAGFEETRALHKDAAQHRFIRGREVIDVLVADHVAPAVLSTRAVPSAVRAPGGTRALRSTVDVTVKVNVQGASIEVSLPNDFGALVLKASAYVADRRDRDRHLEDLMTLLASASDTRSVIERCNEASPETRARVSMALHAIRTQRLTTLTPAVRLALDEFEFGLLGEADRARERG